MRTILLLCVLIVSNALWAQPRLVVQTGHTARVNAVAVDNNRSLVATASNDHTVRVWQITAPSTGTVLRTFSGHSGFVTDVAFNVNDETQLASCALDKTVRLWQLDKGQAQRVDLESPASCLAYQPRSNIIAVGMRDDRQIRFIDANNGTPTDRPVEVPAPVTSIAYTRDGASIICGLSTGVVVVFDSRTKQEKGRYSVSSTPVIMVAEAATCVVAVAASGQCAEIRESAEKKVETVTLSMRTSARQASLNTGRDTVLVATDNDHVIRVPIGRTGQDVVKVDAKGIDAVVQNADGLLMVYGEVKAQQYAWWLQQSRNTDFFVIPSSSRIVTRVSFSPRSDMMAVGDNHGSVAIYGLRRPFHVNFKDIGLLSVQSLAWTMDGNRLFAGGFGEMMAVEIDVDEFRVIRSYPGTGTVSAFLTVWNSEFQALDAVAKLVIAMKYDSTGVMTSTVVLTASAAAQSPMGIRHVLIDRDSVLQRTQGEMTFADNVALKDQKIVLPASPITAVACGDAQSDLAIGTADGAVMIYNLETGARAQIREGAHDAEVTALLLAGNMVASASVDGSIKIWDRRTMEPKMTWRDHDGEVRHLAIASNGAMIASASNDGTVIIHEVGTKVVRLVPMDEDWIAIDQNDRFDGTAIGRSLVKAVQGLNIVDLEGYQDEYYQPGILTGFGPWAVQTKALRKIMVEPSLPKVTIDRNAMMSQEHRNGIKVLANVSVTVPSSVKVRVHHNDKVVALYALDIDSGSVPIATELAPVGGKNHVRVSVETGGGAVLSDTITTYHEVKRSTVPKLWIVAVGIDTYLNPTLNLQCAVNDAKSVFNTVGSDDNRAYRDQKTTLITNASATFDEIKESIDKVVGEASPQDAFIFYYAGHGAVVPQGNDKQFCFVLHDVVNATDASSLREHGITSDTLRSWLRRIPCLRQVVVIDACYSGEVATTPTEIDNARFIASMQRSTGATIIAGVPPNAKAKEELSLKHGLFTHTVLQGLSGGARDADGEVTVLGLLNYLTKAVPATYAKYSQEPVYPIVRFEGSARTFTIWK